MALSEYSQRMNRVLDRIDQHLDAPLDLDELARVANFSPFHFHRVFSGWLGETLSDYLQRRRLAVGAIRLAARSGDSVLSVALSVGFGSGEAFARAFKRQFGCTPTIWRMQTPQRWTQELVAAKSRKSERKLDQEIRNPGQAAQALFVDHDGVEQSIRRQKVPVRLTEFPAARVAYLRKIGPPGPSVGKFVHEVFMPW
jgi:AraC family transcriptional regulator